MRLGIGPAAWGVRRGLNPLAIDWRRFLDEVVLADYDGVELGTWGFLPVEPQRLIRELKTRQLSLAAGQLNADFTNGDAWPAVTAHATEIVDLLHDAGAESLILLGTYAPRERIPNLQTHDDRWSRLVERIVEIARVANKRNIRAAYHPHAGGPIESEEEVERFLSDTANSGLVWLCFDTGHHAYAGADPASFIRRHSDRIAHVHLKNIDRAVRDDAVASGTSFTDAVGLGAVTDLESGVIDLTAVRDALQGAGYERWVVVEQDLNPNSTEPPMDTAARNRSHLRKLDFE